MVKKQVMIVTGTSKGIGKLLVEYYIKRGYLVIGCSRSSYGCKSTGYRHFCLDVSEEIKIKEMFNYIRKNYGRLDVLINNAGTISTNYTLLTPVDMVQKTMNTNFLGTFLFSREAVKLMQNKHHGRIINISTIAVPLALPGTAIYSASKAAVEQFSRVLAKESFLSGITVNTLGLSFVKGGGMGIYISKKSVNETLEKTITKSWLDFKDVVNVINFFISPQSNSITGQIFYLGGT